MGAKLEKQVGKAQVNKSTGNKSHHSGRIFFSGKMLGH